MTASDLSPHRGWLIASGVLSVAAVLAVLLHVPERAAFAVVLLFVIVAPGTAVLYLLRGSAPSHREAGLVVALGIAVTVLVAQAFVWAHLFAPRPEVIGYAVVLFAACAMRPLFARRRSVAAGVSDDDADPLPRGDYDEPYDVDLSPSGDHDVPDDAEPSPRGDQDDHDDDDDAVPGDA